MRDQRESFGDAEIVVVTFAARERLAAYREHLAVPFTIVTDADRRIYRALGADRGTARPRR